MWYWFIHNFTENLVELLVEIHLFLGVWHWPHDMWIFNLYKPWNLIPYQVPSFRIGKTTLRLLYHVSPINGDFPDCHVSFQGGKLTPWKMNGWNLNIAPFRKEYDLPNIHDNMFQPLFIRSFFVMMKKPAVKLNTHLVSLRVSVFVFSYMPPSPLPSQNQTDICSPRNFTSAFGLETFLS